MNNRNDNDNGNDNESFSELCDKLFHSNEQTQRPNATNKRRSVPDNDNDETLQILTAMAIESMDVAEVETMIDSMLVDVVATFKKLCGNDRDYLRKLSAGDIFIKAAEVIPTEMMACNKFRRAFWSVSQSPEKLQRVDNEIERQAND